ncbi:MAG: cytochrome c oxidase subunit 3 family protein [Moritella sp.]|uniref:cytochrome c oxidase subunit 3 family protein n=1 Tax=Moritella sp. TaxID=78556 RepID=UPI0029BE03CD|nr:cytochrome c oxidase subunit 3 family protein [Moritella sp.]MDX2322387.1 cytochrome c oxidase subunit 3 family protein [Moritella sp.]
MSLLTHEPQSEVLQSDVQHHLSNQTQNTADDKVPGNIAVWILIYAELTEFGLFFVIFLIAKAANPLIFAEGPAQLHTSSGAANTLILLTSSFFVARAIHAIKRDKLKSCQRWLWLTLVAGSAYLATKAWEYGINADNGIDGTSNLFFTIYYYLTFNHLLHVMMGMCTIGWVLVRSYIFPYSKDDHEGLESAACYWHMVDLVWIMIFPLLYVLR